MPADASQSPIQPRLLDYEQKILLLSFLSPELCNYNTQSVSTTKVKSNCKHHTLVVDSGVLHSSSVQICISMASGYTGISSLQRHFSSLVFFPLEEAGRDELQWVASTRPVQALGASLWSMLQNTLAHSACLRHKCVLQKAQVELRAVTKRTSRLIRWVDPTLP